MTREESLTRVRAEIAKLEALGVKQPDKRRERVQQELADREWFLRHRQELRP